MNRSPSLKFLDDIKKEREKLRKLEKEKRLKNLLKNNSLKVSTKHVL
jgi:hypothetical protein